MMPVTTMMLSLLHAMRFIMIRRRWFGLNGLMSSVVSSTEFASVVLIIGPAIAYGPHTGN